jgi:phospholipid-transporting ATPase
VGVKFKKRGGEFRQFLSKRWQQIKVGQIVKVHENEYFPCDLLLLNSSLPKGVCYVETKNLDGESNLKHKQAHKDVRVLCKNDSEILSSLEGTEIECEKQNEFLYKFMGQMRINDQVIPLDESQMLLRGSSLRNTEWIYGVAIYTGHHAKVMMNSSKSKPKFSKIEIATNGYLLMGVGIQLAVCMSSALYSSLWERLITGNNDNPWYLELDRYYPSKPADISQWQQKTGFQSLLLTIPINYGKWFLAMMNFVSISLLVSLEMVKFVQGLFMEYDVLIYDEDKDMPTKVQSSNLNEELGMVNYIFSDKTGTLTQNIMEFKKFSAGYESYGDDLGQ